MMNKNNLWTSLLPLLLISILIGCSGDATAPDGAPISDKSADTLASRQLWGLWDVTVDGKSGTIDAVPIRGAEIRVNVLVFLEPPQMSNLKIDFSDLKIIPPSGGNDGRVLVDVIIKHPFPGQTFFTGFDVKGIVFGPRLDNADGSTRWWNPVEFTGAGRYGFQPGLLGTPDVSGFTGIINDYKYFAYMLGENESLSDWSTASKMISYRGHFPAGETLSRHYEINFGPDAADFMKFQYAVDASWAAPVGDPPYDWTEFPPKANQPEAWNITADVIENSLNYYNDEGSGNLLLHVAVYDWQGCDDTIVSLTCDEPGVFDTVVESTPFVDYGNLAIYELSVAGAEPLEAGTLPLTIAAESSDVTYQYGDPPPSPNPDEPVTEYKRFEVKVDDHPPGGECDGSLHAENGWQTSLALDPSALDHMWDMAFITSGQYDGDALYFWRNDTGPIAEIRYFDADNPVDEPPRGVFHTLPDEDKPEWIWSIDCDPVMGRVLYVGDDKPDTFRVMSDSGSKLGEFPVEASSNVIAIQAACFDGSGNLWVLSLRTTAFEPDYELRRYQPTDGAPYYVEDQYLDLSPYNPFSLLSFIYDMDYSIQSDRLYIFDMHGSFGDYGSVDVFDVAPDGTPTQNNTVSKEDIFPVEVDLLPSGPDGRHDWYFHTAWGGDIVIDHASGENERCRIVCMAVLDDDSGDGDTDTYWILYDEDLNIVDDYHEPYDPVTGGKCWDTFAINQDENRNVAAMWHGSTWEYAAKPVDW